MKGSKKRKWYICNKLWVVNYKTNSKGINMYWKQNISNIQTLADAVFAIWCCGVVDILVDICIAPIWIIKRQK